MEATEHESTLEHALDVAKANAKQAKLLVDHAKAALAHGDVTPERVAQLEELQRAADEDLQRVIREQ
ncbi:hypothetical protein [Sinomonas atrocyanea]|jgi:hypothetical protein|uniref:hypothetical protein n=1 Tax=Sinomonas atrocyanea TaxID=37927 RepID=UPI0027868C48|nr:hypothetical protein [Sinomonas atrocyanea]MDQ0261643.1 hypothetical protein [Sinomonas atrocyanea]MDR6623457.1 hypothetical protein [Sinomonas atrocyanea]